MTDAELQAKYPLPPEMQELAETMMNGGKPVARPAAVGIEQMQVILKKLKQDKIDTLAALDECPPTDKVRHDALVRDLADLKKEISLYTDRLKEYEVQQEGLN